MVGNGFKLLGNVMSYFYMNRFRYHVITDVLQIYFRMHDRLL